MRVIAGKAKGRNLTAPKGLQTRPVPAMIKEALYNIWQSRIDGARFLDLFAGSGSMGIEALSRGAEHVVFVDQDRKAIQAIRSNLALCRFTEGWEVFQDDVFRRITRLKEQGQKFDIIYADPPFTVEKIFLPLIEALSDACLLAEYGQLVIRTKKEMRMPDALQRLEQSRMKTYGISNVYFYSRSEQQNFGPNDCK